MTTPIKSTDHAALNAAFAEHVCGWTNLGTVAAPKWDMGNGWIHHNGTQPFTTSADAVLPWLYKHWCWRAVQSEPRRHFVTVWADGIRFEAIAPTLHHAAVVALLRAKGIQVED